MFNLQVTSTTMQLLALACLCLLTRSGTTFADEHEPVTIKVNKMSDVILPCSLGTNEDIESKLFVWKKSGQKAVFYYDEHDGFGLGRFKGRVSHFPDGLKYGNASIIIRNTKLSDSGNYICDFPRLQPRQKFHIQLVVAMQKHLECLPGFMIMKVMMKSVFLLSECSSECAECADRWIDRVIITWEKERERSH
ncbi:immunoglobulin superfamily member 11-like isoform X3 [Micropterus dolomieu]|uniref:immunoglobulin superfamily member 11-like isoform X3 n=1 Tax=Micropterus dolomieu TaxID=147949 RepID=UPI001E8D361E|nr:immunoglobulin superfamily member 11-like isoform X3 [Micropterus dolomieu]